MIVHYLMLFFFFLLFPIYLGGIVRKVRAMVQGRKGPSILQSFYDIVRYMKKRPIDNSNSGFFAEVAPPISILAGLCIWSLVVFEWTSLLLIPCFLLLQRLCITGFGMETGSSFGGLGTSREILLGVVSEPLIVIGLIVAVSKFQVTINVVGLIVGFLFISAFTLALLAEMSKPPFDDPRTHLELTMVHEAMLLEASGRTLGAFEIGSNLKVASLLTLIMKVSFEHTSFYIPQTNSVLIKDILLIFGAVFLSCLLGYWEAVSVRRKWQWIPEMMGITLLFLLALGSLIKL
ncbi:MAG: NADH-quinone oxidoreductase subunit H [Leptospiraceae bacterium]|nr:NADH-quinone oxidoreductase subunit H [Leptospiraceae bacterium]